MVALNNLYIFRYALLMMNIIFLSVVDITPQEGLQKLDDPNVIYLDVREPHEYEAGHIPSAILMPLNSGVLYDEWHTLPTDKEIVVYCRLGGRSAIASNYLAEQGMSGIHNMTGGFTAYSSLADAKIEIGPYQGPITEVTCWTLY